MIPILINYEPQFKYSQGTKPGGCVLSLRTSGIGRLRSPYTLFGANTTPDRSVHSKRTGVNAFGKKAETSSEVILCLR